MFTKLWVVGGWMEVWARHNNNNHYAQLKKLNGEEKIGFLERTMQFSGSWSQGATFIFLRFLQIPNHLLERETFVSSISTSPLTTLKNFTSVWQFQSTRGPYQKVCHSCWNIQQYNIYYFQFWRKKNFTKKVFTINFWRLVSCEERSESEKEEISLSGWANEGSASSQTGGCGY